MRVIKRIDPEGPGWRPGVVSRVAALLLLAACARPGDPVQTRALHGAATGRDALLSPALPAPRPDAAADALRQASGPVLPWTVRPGTTLRGELDLWAGQAGWQLVWRSEHAYPIRAGARFTGTFPQAAYALVGAFRQADPPPVITYYPANRVVTVHSLPSGEEEED